MIRAERGEGVARAGPGRAPGEGLHPRSCPAAVRCRVLQWVQGTWYLSYFLQLHISLKLSENLKT